MFGHESQSVNWMAQSAREKGAKFYSAWLKRPTLQPCSANLRKQISNKRKRRRGEQIQKNRREQDRKRLLFWVFRRLLFWLWRGKRKRERETRVEKIWFTRRKAGAFVIGCWRASSERKSREKERVLREERDQKPIRQSSPPIPGAPIKDPIAAQHMKSLSNRLRHYGLRYEDPYDPYYIWT
ncbi:hypothetical protein BT93_L0852 [Corymbia citriodora subsp. variegata]|uniref:Uncharacterized protein n=1 Tax=Corymbia citriodora subsp. variegata TaxID=360336 RepID=A0A8T0CNZ4_CORYI|nr:hypothetical protein BT93_L0852 [Corymbia citriodora subsp. variegata]